MNQSQNNQCQLIIISSVESYRDHVIKLVKSAKIQSFTIHSAHGFKDVSAQHIEDNWFGAETNETSSVVFHIYTSSDLAKELLLKIKEFNLSTEYTSKIHMVVLNLENSSFE
jgi:hypothetical protein